MEVYPIGTQTEIFFLLILITSGYLQLKKHDTVVKIVKNQSNFLIFTDVGRKS